MSHVSNGHTVYPLAELQRRNAEGDHTGLDPRNLELYLTDRDFAAAFGMDRERYEKLPQWRKSNLKKKAGIF